MAIRLLPLWQKYSYPEYLVACVIVCPNNQDADAINDYIVNLVPGDSDQYLSCDTISKSSKHIPNFDILYPTEFLNSINASSHCYVTLKP
jgi:ATP-dependent DNA helicase PIF1